MSQLARVVELLLQLPQQSPARLRCHVLRSCRSVACADKAHTVKGDGVAEACAVRTHAACTSTLVALRPPLRVCEPFFKISFLALGSRSTSGSCRVQTTGRRDATVSSSITSRMAHRLGSLGYQPGPSKPDLGVRSAHQPPACSGRATLLLPLFFADRDTIRSLERGCHARPFFLVRLAPPYPCFTRVGGGAINSGGYCAAHRTATAHGMAT